jgi:hypothetical protein
MRYRSRSRNPLLRRAPAIAVAMIVETCLFSLATAAQPPAVPVLKGGYVLTQVNNCVRSSTSFYQLTGSIDFNPKTGKYKLDGYSAADDPLELTHITGNATYSNSGSTLTLGDTTLQVFYGKLENGVATYLSAITVLDSCGYQISMSRQ